MNTPYMSPRSSKILLSKTRQAALMSTHWPNCIETDVLFILRLSDLILITGNILLHATYLDAIEW